MGRLLLWAAVQGALGCGAVHRDSPDGDADADADSDSDSDSDSDADTDVDLAPGTVDVLLVVDAVPALAEEKVLLADALPAFVDALVTGGATDLHLGVVSTDMGAQKVPGCTETGDMGILRHDPDPANASCNAGYPPWLEWEAGGAPVGEDFRCIAVLGEGGCGWEQPFASASTAVGPASEPGGPNAGFVRSGAVHALVILEDEDDCSVEDPAIWTMGSPLNLRCSQEDEMLVGVDAFAQDLFALEPGHAERIVFLGIAGFPGSAVLTDAAISTPEIQGADDFQAIADDPLMVPTVDDTGSAIRPVCETIRGRGYPSPRVLGVARAIDAAGGGGLVHTTCAGEYDVALRGLAEEIVRRF